MNICVTAFIDRHQLQFKTGGKQKQNKKTTISVASDKTSTTFLSEKPTALGAKLLEGCWPFRGRLHMIS